MSLQLFDAFVSSIINYGSVVWGFSKSKELERLHLKFCKSILGVKQTTCNVAVYGELGRYPLYINRYVIIIKYWLNLIHSDNILLKYVYRTAVSDCENGKKNWIFNIKQILHEYGLFYAWENAETINHTQFIANFKQRMIDCFLQKWYTDLQNTTLLKYFYKHIKQSFTIETYLNKLTTKTHRRNIAKIRLSSHNLRIETARYARERVDREERVCKFCTSMEVEDEYHFILCCPAFLDIRKMYIKRYYFVRPSMFKLVELFTSENRKTLLHLSKYISNAFKVRKELENILEY